MIELRDFVRVSDNIWQIPRTFRNDMRVPARVYASEAMLTETLKDQSLEQLVNASTLPGVTEYALAMPDVHQGYGFAVGGVAAMRLRDGVISPGAIGYDINCGVRLLASELDASEAAPLLEALATTLYQTCPSGVGQGGLDRAFIQQGVQEGTVVPMRLCQAFMMGRSVRCHQRRRAG